MTELERYTPRSAPTGLQAWAAEATAAVNIAQQLAGTPWVPASLRVMDRGQLDVAATTANIAAALLTGQELGLEPMAALRSVDVVNGTPALRAITLRALVQAAGHDIWVHESTATRAIVRGRRGGRGEIQEAVWTMDRAQKLGLTGKDNWRKQPTAMLVARATSEMARLIGADAILGLAYSAEELDDGTDSAAPDEPVTTTPRRVARRRTVPAVLDGPPAADEPVLDQPTPTVAPEPDPDPFDRPRTDAQSKRLHATLRELGITDRGEGLGLISGIIGREIESTNALTVAEAIAVIDELDRKAAVRHATPDAPIHTDEPEFDTDNPTQPQPAAPEPAAPSHAAAEAGEAGSGDAASPATRRSVETVPPLDPVATRTQLNQLRVLLRAHNGTLTELVVPIIGHPIHAATALTQPEAEQVIGELQGRLDRAKEPEPELLEVEADE